MVKHPFYIGQWQATPTTNTLRLGDSVKQLEPKAMDVLLLLCQRKGDVLSADDIADSCWGDMVIGDNPVHKAITQLRKALGDRASTPTYIETIRKRGYQIIADVSFPLENTPSTNKTNWQGGSPFPGLSAFETTDAEVFFGRNEQIAMLLNRLSQRISHQHAFTLILGPSGTGKSSLINAGVLPRLMNTKGYDGFRVETHVSIDLADVTQGRLLLDLAGTLLDWDINDIPVFDGMSADALASILTSDIGNVIERCEKACALHENSNLIGLTPFLSLFVDRLEIILSSPIYTDEDRSLLLSIIEALANSGSVIVFSACRNDFYPLVVNQPSLMSGKSYGSHFDLAAPTHADLSQMIRLPASTANLTWSKDATTGLSLDEIIATEATNNPDALPMLQYTLQELYLQRSESSELLTSVYKALGGIEGAIGKKAEEIHQQLPQSRQQELAYVLSLLVTLNTDGKTITSRAARWSQLSTSSQKDFVQAMVDSRLFVSHLQNEEPCFSVAHEALLRRWPRASEWIATHREDLTIKGQLQELSERWLKEDRSRAYLLIEGKPLQEALNLKNNTAFTLEAQELDLINTSANRAKVKRWGKRAIVTLLCLLTFTSILMSYKSQQSEYLAQQKRLEAESLLGFMVGEFADKLRSVRRMDLLDGISNKAIEYFSTNDDETNTLIPIPFAKSARGFKERFQHAQTLEAMGEVAYSRGKTEEATTAFSEAQKLLQKLLTEQSKNSDLLKILGANAFWLGQLKYDVSEFDRAEPLFQQYLNYSERMYELAPNDIDALIELSYANSTLGSLYAKKSNYLGAKTAFESSLELTNELLKQQPSDRSLLTDKADTLTWVATIEPHLGNLDKSLKTHQQAQLALEKILLESPSDANILEPLSYSYWHQAKILNYFNETSQAYEKASQAAETLKKAISQDSDNKIWATQLQSVQILQIRLSSLLGNTNIDIDTESLNAYLNDIDTIPSSRPRIFVDIGQYHQLINDWHNSGRFIENVKGKFSEYYQQNQDEPDYVLAWAEFNLLEAKQLAYNYQKTGQVEACKIAVKLLQPLVNKSRHAEYLLPYAEAHSCLNQLQKATEEVNHLKSMGITNFQFFFNHPKEVTL